MLSNDVLDVRPRVRGGGDAHDVAIGTCTSVAEKGWRSAAMDSRSARPIVSAATPRVQAVSNGVGCPLPGVTTIASGTNQTTPSRGRETATGTSEKREVVEPYDGSEGEGGGDRDDERASVVTATCEDDDADQQRCAEYEPDGARDGRRQADVEADDVGGVGVLADGVLEPSKE